MNLSRLVREDHLVWAGVLGLAGERQVLFIADCVPYLQATGDLGDVEDGHRDREGDRSGVAYVDERVQLRKCPLLPQAPQQRL